MDQNFLPKLSKSKLPDTQEHVCKHVEASTDRECKTVFSLDGSESLPRVRSPREGEGHPTACSNGHPPPSSTVQRRKPTGGCTSGWMTHGLCKTQGWAGGSKKEQRASPCAEQRRPCNHKLFGGTAPGMKTVTCRKKPKTLQERKVPNCQKGFSYPFFFLWCPSRT